MLNNFGVKLLAICFHCDLMCEIDFWNDLVLHLTINCFGSQFHFIGEFMERKAFVLILVSFEKQLTNYLTSTLDNRWHKNL